MVFFAVSHPYFQPTASEPPHQNWYSFALIFLLDLPAIKSNSFFTFPAIFSLHLFSNLLIPISQLLATISEKFSCSGSIVSAFNISTTGDDFGNQAEEHLLICNVLINVDRKGAKVGTAILFERTDDAQIPFSARCTKISQTTINAIISSLFPPLSSARKWSHALTHWPLTRCMRFTILLECVHQWCVRVEK